MAEAHSHFLPSTAYRVPLRTSAGSNEKILREMEDRVSRYASNPQAIPSRLREMEYEWDIERALEAHFSVAAILGSILGFTVNRKFYALPAIAGVFQLMHSLEGWCPPVALYRKLGFRTQREIEAERYSLKASRGDFDGFSGAGVMGDRLLKAADPMLYK